MSRQIVQRSYITQTLNGSGRSFESAQQIYKPVPNHTATNGDTIANYQYTGAMFLVSNRHCLLADDMGIGKTVQALVSFAPWDRVIVSCPKSAKHNWFRECRKWRPDLRVDIDSGFRRPERGEIVVVTHQGLPKPFKPRKGILTPLIMHDVKLIIDEAQVTKGGDAQLTERHRMLGSQCMSVQGLTGTPMPGTPLDLWGVLLSLKIAQKAFPGFEEIDVDEQGMPIRKQVKPFEQFKRLCNGERKVILRKKMGKWVEIETKQFKWGAISPEVGERLKSVMLRRTKAEVLPELPSKRYQDLFVDAPSDLIPYLNEVKDKWYELDADDLPPFELVAEARAALARSRIDCALEYAQSSASMQTPMLVFSSHVEPIEAMGRLVGFATITGETTDNERKAAVDDFQSGKLRGLAISTQSGGTALNLTAAQTVLFVDKPWNPSDVDQAEDRAMRRGQKKSVLIVSMVSNHPIDIRVNEILTEKRRMNKEVFG